METTLTQKLQERVIETNCEIEMELIEQSELSKSHKFLAKFKSTFENEKFINLKMA